MLFRYPQRRDRFIQDLSITINGHTIERVQDFDFLGLTIDETLSWKKTYRENINQNFESDRHTK